MAVMLFLRRWCQNVAAAAATAAGACASGTVGRRKQGKQHWASMAVTLGSEALVPKTLQLLLAVEEGCGCAAFSHNCCNSGALQCAAMAAAAVVSGPTDDLCESVLQQCVCLTSSHKQQYC